MLWVDSFTIDASPQSEKLSWIWEEVPPWRINKETSCTLKWSSFLYRQKELQQQKQLQRIPPEFNPVSSLSI